MNKVSFCFLSLSKLPRHDHKTNLNSNKSIPLNFTSWSLSFVNIRKVVKFSIWWLMSVGRKQKHLCYWIKSTRVSKNSLLGQKIVLVETADLWTNDSKRRRAPKQRSVHTISKPLGKNTGQNIQNKGWNLQEKTQGNKREWALIRLAYLLSAWVWSTNHWDWV